MLLGPQTGCGHSEAVLLKGFPFLLGLFGSAWEVTNRVKKELSKPIIFSKSLNNTSNWKQEGEYLGWAYDESTAYNSTAIKGHMYTAISASSLRPIQLFPPGFWLRNSHFTCVHWLFLKPGVYHLYTKLESNCHHTSLSRNESHIWVHSTLCEWSSTAQYCTGCRWQCYSQSPLQKVRGKSWISEFSRLSMYISQLLEAS